MKFDEIEYTELRYYFAYGMLTDPDIMGDIPMVGSAVLEGYAFELLAYANLIPAAGARTHGVLWEADDDIMEQLDRVEGYPTFYTRKLVPVVADNGEQYTAEVYIMTKQSRRRLEGTAPSADYVDRLINGYKHAGLPLQQLRDALE